MLTFPRKRRRQPAAAERYYDNIITVASREAVPRQLERKIFVVRRNRSDRWLIMTCPCGCGDRIEVNLMRSHTPHWKLRRHKDSVSLWPSLWVSDDRCGSHFRLVSNRVLWVGRKPQSELS